MASFFPNSSGEKIENYMKAVSEKTGVSMNNLKTIWASMEPLPDDNLDLVEEEEFPVSRNWSIPPKNKKWCRCDICCHYNYCEPDDSTYGIRNRQVTWDVVKEDTAAVGSLECGWPAPPIPPPSQWEKRQINWMCEICVEIYN